MPGGRTRFQEKWLTDKDESGTIIGNWCGKGRNEFEAYCRLCNSYLSISNAGIRNLFQHTASQKHTAAAKRLKGQKSFNLFDNQSKASASNSSESTVFLNTNELALKAETLWCLKVAVSDYSFESCKDISPIFKNMFENPVADAMHLSDRKVSYIISHGLGPFFHTELVSDLKDSIENYNFFTLSFDETTTSQVKKQLDIYVRFWSTKSNKIESAYFTSLFFGHATSNLVCQGIIDTLTKDKIPLNKMLMLSMDGPNVNIAIAKQLNKTLAELGSSELISLGTCSLHKVHNCFSKALDYLPFDADEFSSDLFVFFRISPARREDFKKISELLECEQKFFLRHVNSRWLTLGPVITRILTIYSVLEEYFLKFLPKEKSSWNSVQKSPRYQRIVSVLKNPQAKVYLEFISALSPSLNSYLTMFQEEGPLIHLLYNKMNSLLRTIMLKFLKEDCVGHLQGKMLMALDVHDPKNYRLLKEMDIGMGTIRALSFLKENDAKECRMYIRTFLINLCKLLKDSLPLCQGFLKDLQLLHPALRTSFTEKSIRRLCVRLKPLKMSDETIDSITHEWQMYKLDEEVDDLSKHFEQEDKNKSVDIFWRDVFSLTDKCTGQLKYRNLQLLIKNCLSLSHGNSDVERGFSLNHNILSDKRQNLSEASIIGIRQVKDVVRRNGAICAIPITKKLLNAVATSHSVYSMEKDKKKAEDLQKKRALEEELKLHNEAKKLKDEREDVKRKLDTKINSLKGDLDLSQNYLNENTQRLQNAIKIKNFGDVKVASMAIEVATTKVQNITKELNKLQEERLKLHSK